MENEFDHVTIGYGEDKKIIPVIGGNKGEWKESLIKQFPEENSKYLDEKQWAKNPSQDYNRKYPRENINTGAKIKTRECSTEELNFIIKKSKSKIFYCAIVIPE